MTRTCITNVWASSQRTECQTRTIVGSAIRPSVSVLGDDSPTVPFRQRLPPDRAISLPPLNLPQTTIGWPLGRNGRTGRPQSALSASPRSTKESSFCSISYSRRRWAGGFTSPGLANSVAGTRPQPVIHPHYNVPPHPLVLLGTTIDRTVSVRNATTVN